jgi:threonine synthase
VDALRCVACSSVTITEALDPSCDRCGSAVMLDDGPPPEVSRSQLESAPPGVWRYAPLLPKVSPAEVVTLGEGGTPLLRTRRLGEELGLRNLLIKDESRNPTGSFMDRGATVLLSLAMRRRMKECVCATTGNLGASLAAYCAKAGIDARLRIHPGTDRGKFYQMLAYGADVESSTIPPKSAGKGSLSVTAGNPYLIEGEKTTGFEIVQDLGWQVPDVIIVPVGTGGHLSTIWRALAVLSSAGLAGPPRCRLIGVQVTGSKPEGQGRRTRPDSGDSMLAELEGSVPYYQEAAARAISESGGLSLTTTVAQTIESTGLLAKTEGIFAEPSSASVLGAAREAVRRGAIRRSDSVVCVITGAGLKDPKSVARLARETRRVSIGGAYALPSPKIGATKLALLRILRKGPGYGYELWLKIGAERKISTASIYQHLSELEGYSMVRKSGTTVSGGRERVLYELTRRGTDFLKLTGRFEQADAG